MNRRVLHSHGCVLKKSIQVGGNNDFLFFFKDKNTKIVLLSLIRNSTDSIACNYSAVCVDVGKEQEGRAERQAGRKPGSLKCALRNLCIQLLPCSYCCPLQNGYISVPR